MAGENIEPPLPVEESARRTRTYRYADAARVSREQRSAPGLPYLEGVRDGRYANAPMAYTIGWSLTEVERGRVTLALDPGEHLFNPHVLHGGVFSTLLDSATACAVISTLTEDQACTSLEIKTNFLRAVAPGSGTILCEGRVIHAGRRSAVAEAEVFDGGGKKYARATATFLIYPNPLKHGDAANG
ncbi:MAG: PaaI family thioesterase [Gammaproteobacteria bacterium]